MMKPHISLKVSAVSAAIDPAAHRGASLLDNDVILWNPRQGSADSDLLPELRNLVTRSRDIDRNNGIAHGGLQTRVDNVVGTGLRLSSRPDYKALGKTKEWADDWSRQFEGLFHSYWWTTACHAGDTMTGDQLTAQVFRTGDLSGEFLALAMWIPEREDGFSTKIMTIEPDRLAMPPYSMESSRFRGGIEFDRYGAPLTYHIKDTHPGDSYWDAAAESKNFGWTKVARKTEFGRLQVLHGFDAERPGQSRGKPVLASILPQFKQIDRMTNAEITKAIVQAMHVMTVETPMEADDIVDMFKDSGGAQAYLEARKNHAVALKNGTVASMFPGDKVSAFLATSPTSTFAAFFEVVARILGVGLDLPYELLMKDFSKTNYSSARAALLEAWRGFTRRRDWLGTQFMDPISWLFLEEMVNAGRIDAPGFYQMRWAYQRCKWIGPGRGWIDPVKEADAAQTRITIGVSTLEDECAEQGKDWEEVLEQQARENDRRRELGIPVPGAVAPGKQYPSDDPAAPESAPTKPPPKPAAGGAGAVALP